jgi:hypothetical protein
MDMKKVMGEHSRVSDLIETLELQKAKIQRQIDYLKNTFEQQYLKEVVAAAAADREALGIGAGSLDGVDAKQRPEHVPHDSVAQTLEDMNAAGLL